MRGIGVAAVLALGLMGGNAAAASATGLRAVPATPLSSARSVVVDDIAWKCGASGCAARESGSRPEVTCARAARKIGVLASFSVDGRVFSEEELARCNARAR